MKFAFLLIWYIVSIVTSIICEDGYTFVFIRKQSQFNANEEKFKILKGNQVVYQNPDMVDFQLREIEACIDNSVNAQYTLELSDQ